MRGIIGIVSVLSIIACGSEAPPPTPKADATPASTEKSAAAKSCSYTLTEATPSWTAYKFTEKTGVSGSFTSTTLSATKAGPSLAAAIEGVTMTIDPASVSSGNAGRDMTIQQKYFGLFAPQTEMTAGVVAVKGDDKAGTVDVNLGMNGVNKTISFPYEMAEDGTLTAKADMEMMDFGLKAAFDSIHTACKLLHTGEDGVAKTWTDVALSITAKIAKECS